MSTLAEREAADFIRRRASVLGFDPVHFCSAAGAPGSARFARFLDEGRHASMGWLERSAAPRHDPRLLLPEARSAVVLGMRYGGPVPPDPGGLTGRVASYAWGRDYHNLIGKRLRKLSRDLRKMGIANYWGVDARPLIERAWAERAGLGFLGRNCCTILPGEGSYLFLAVVLVAIDLPPAPRLPGWDLHCGRCRRCLDSCPTNALLASGQLDSRRCISYLTIEHRGEIPLDLRPLLGRWVFGCDDCQEVCPHNHDDSGGSEPDFDPRPGHAWLDLDWVLRTEDSVLDAHFEGSPLRRPRPVGLKRNACVVLGNLGDPQARGALHIAERHADPIVQSHARWALDRI